MKISRKQKEYSEVILLVFSIFFWIVSSGILRTVTPSDVKSIFYYLPEFLSIIIFVTGLYILKKLHKA